VKPFVTASETAGEKKMHEQAAAWFARLSGGFATHADRTGFAAWLAETPAHAVAYAAFDEVWARTETLKAAIPSVPVPQRPAANPVRRRAAAGVALAAACAVLAFLPPVRDLWQYDALRTGPGERRTVQLQDGSTVHLDGATELRVRMRDGQRRVQFVTGEALFDVAKDSSRPFLVDTGVQTVRVVGTVFDVRRADQQVAVAVSEGKVRVGDTIELAPGQRASFEPAAAAGTISAVPLDRVGSWRQDVLYYDPATVAEIVADLNRRFVPAIQLADARLAASRVHTTLIVQDRAAMIRTLETLLSARATTRADGVTILERR
jgi:transmembrane sensor